MTESLNELFVQPELPVDIPERCRGCVTLARMALRYGATQEKIQTTQDAALSGALQQRWVKEATAGGKRTLEQAEQYVESHIAQLRDQLGQYLEGLDTERERQVVFAQYVIDHCKYGVVKLQSVTEGVDIAGEVCGTTTPELVTGVDGAEIVRVIRSPAVVKLVD